MTRSLTLRVAALVILFVTGLPAAAGPAVAPDAPPRPAAAAQSAAPGQQIDSDGTLADLPFLRNGHTAVYDDVGNRILLFGGWNGQSYFNDLWALDPTVGSEAWARIDPAGSLPPARGQHSAILDSWNHRMIVFGGRGRLQGFNDVWALDLTAGAEAWTELTPSGAPPSPRRWHTAIYDHNNQRMIVFGGSSGGDVLAETWALDLSTPGAEAWTELDLGISIPSPRAQHSAVYDQPNQRMILFGGFTAGTPLNDVWELDLTLGGEVWTQMGPAGTFPAIRRGHSAVIDHLGHMLVLGGAGTTAFYNDLWRLELTAGAEQWVQLSPGGTLPSGRAWHSATMSSGAYRMFVLGGRGMGQGGGMQWVFDPSGLVWSPLAASLPVWWQGGGGLQGGQTLATVKPQVTLALEDARPDTVVNLMRGTEVWFTVRIATASSTYKNDIDVILDVDMYKIDILKAGTRQNDADDVVNWVTPDDLGAGRYQINNVDLLWDNGDAEYNTQVIFRGTVKTDAAEGTTPIDVDAFGTNWLNHLTDDTTARIYKDPQAWIVTNRRRLYVEFVNADVSNLLAEVFEQAQGAGYNDNPTAVVLYADRYHPSLRDWDNTNVDYTTPSSANLMANTLDDWLDTRGVTPEYLLIVGDDNILPRYRKHDYALVCGDGPCAEIDHPTCYGEEPVCNSLVAHNYFMTDNPYGDIAGGTDWQEGDLEIAVGRIVGIDPIDMQRFLENSANGPTSRVHKAILASGGEDHNDLWMPGDDNDAHDILKYALGYTMDEGLIDTGPTKDDVVDAIEAGFNVMVAAGHGEMDDWIAPGGKGSYPDAHLFSFDMDTYDSYGRIPTHRPFFLFQACRVGLSYTDGWNSWGPPYNDDSMVYALANLGASAVIASSGLSYGCFDPNCALDGEVLTNEFWLSAYAYPDRSDPLGWALMQTKDLFTITDDFSRKTVQSFTYFGVPWIRLPGAGQSVKGGALPIPADTASSGWSRPAQAGIDATYVITTHVDASTYAISTTAAGWNLIEVQGLTQRLASGAVTLPKAGLQLLLPLSATVTSLAFTPTDGITLTGLDIPTLYAGEPISGGLRGGFAATLDGLHPVTATWQPRMLDTHQLVIVQVIPVTYDATADEAVLYRSVDVAITYDTPRTVALTFYDTNQVHYLPGEAITATARIINAGDVTETVTGTLILQDAAGHVVGFRGSGPRQVPAGGSYDLVLGWSGALEEDAYSARLLIWQAGQVVAGAGREVYVYSGQIAAVGVPNLAWAGTAYSLTVTFDNLGSGPTIAVGSVAIYDAGGSMVGFLPPQTVAVTGTMSATMSFSWTPPRSGTYVASAVVMAGGQEYGPVAETFTAGYKAYLPVVLKANP